MAERDTHDLIGRFVDFGHALREHGLPVGSDDVIAFCEAVAELSPGDQLDVYWAGRTTLVHRRDHLPVYDEVFRQFFMGIAPPKPNGAKRERATAQGSTGVLDVPDSEPGDQPSDERPMVLGLQASGVMIERTKAFSACTDDELAALRRLISRIRLEPPLRRTRRRCPDPKGATLDIRRMARESMRLNDVSPQLLRTDRKLKARPLVLLLDVSGSMADYSRNLLQFAYSMRRAAQKVEVFCFGTRLTRITAVLDRRNPDDAMRLAASRVLDWDGGTRIGESIDDFVSSWGRRGISRGATVVVCSDGLDRGDPALLSASMERLQRLSQAILWLSPLAKVSGEVPDTLAMAVVAPYVDAVEPVHDFASLEAFAGRLAEIG